jgi:hypothetical protein
MAKFTPDAVLDKMADYIIANATTEYLCSGQPTNFAGIAAVALADVAIDSGDFTKGDGTPDGRDVDVAGQADVVIDTSGTANHVALASGSELLYVTTCPDKVLTSGGGNVAAIAGFTITLRDPT